ncbi:MAG: hypothetical protein E6344_10680 [Clostridium sp.]|nr:hypothetical protein [Clostridium sp.]MDU7084149.1 hypothetical protein [Clostridium sp.]
MSKKKKILLTSGVMLIICTLVFFIFTKPGKVIREAVILVVSGQSLDLNGDYNEINIIDSVYEDYDLFLSGEAHGVAMSYDMEKYLATYFIKEYGVRNIVVEMSIASGELLNQYLETGDEELLLNILNKFKSTYANNQDTYELFKYYYELNKELPGDKKLTLVPIDIEHETSTTGIYINNLMQGLGEPPEAIKEMVIKIKNIGSFYDRFFLKDLIKSLEEDRTAYEEYFKEKFFYFDLVVNNIKLDYTNEEREAAMVHNFISYYEKLGGGKFYGQCGRAHVQKLNSSEWIDGNKGGVISNYSDINIGFKREKVQVRAYDKIRDKKIYDTFYKYGWSEEEFGELMFIIRGSKASENLKSQ